MFGQASAGLNPDPPARQAAREALDVLAATIRRGVRTGIFPHWYARRLTLAACALVHGLVSLEFDGKLPPAAGPPPTTRPSSAPLSPAGSTPLRTDRINGWHPG